MGGIFMGYRFRLWGYSLSCGGFGGILLLNDMKIKNAKATARLYRLNDGNGLYLWVTPSGGKLWRWKYRQGVERS